MIYDGFIFFNEIELLELRLETMWNYVDKFIIVESRKTFTNVDKELNYEKNRDRFKKYWNKIIYITIDEFPQECTTAWDCEHYQRNAIYRGLKEAKPEDILIVSDLDEIISPYGVKRVVKILNYNPHRLLKLELLNCWYYLNYVDYQNFFLSAPVAYTVRKLENEKLMPQAARSSMSFKYVSCAGWHFTYMGGLDAIKNKIRSFSHQEYNSDEWLDENRIVETIKAGKDLFDRPIAEFGSLPIKFFMPKPVKENIAKYKRYLCYFNPMPHGRILKLKIKYICETTPLRYLYHFAKRVIACINIK